MIHMLYVVYKRGSLEDRLPLRCITPSWLNYITQKHTKHQWEDPLNAFLYFFLNHTCPPLLAGLFIYAFQKTTSVLIPSAPAQDIQMKARYLTWTGLQYWATTPCVWFPNTSVNTRKWYESSLLSLVILKPSGQWQSAHLLRGPLETDRPRHALHTGVTWETELLQSHEVDVLRYAQVLWGGDCWLAGRVAIEGDGSLSLLLERASFLGSAEGRSVRTLQTVTWTLPLNKWRSVNLQHLNLHRGELSVFALKLKHQRFVLMTRSMALSKLRITSHTWHNSLRCSSDTPTTTHASNRPDGMVSTITRRSAEIPWEFNLRLWSPLLWWETLVCLFEWLQRHLQKCCVRRATTAYF